MVNLQQYPIEGITRETELIQSSLTGNTIPTEFYQIITTKSGTPDHVAITIFSEIIYWYRPKKEGGAKFKGASWQSSYSHFEEKFGYYHEKVRRAFVKLEELDLVRREFRAVEHYGQKYPNRLFIHLTNEAYELISKSAGVSETKKFSENKHNVLPRFVEVSPQIVGDYIKETKNIDNNRSIDLESNSIYFSNCKSCMEGKETQKEVGKPSEAVLEKGSEPKPRHFFCKPKALADFYPLEEKDCAILQSKSGRKFNLNAMNEILLSMSKRLVDREFRSKKAFLNYMSKVLSSEMRQAEKINNENFRIRSNKTEEEISLETKEKYLDKVEQSSDVSDLARLKKKLAGRFDTSKAYEIIQGIKQVNKGVSGKIEIEFDKYLELLEIDKEIICNETMSVFDVTGDLHKDDVEILLPDCEVKWSNPEIAEQYKRKQEKLPDNVWGRVRRSLMGEFGKGIDISWFSKLEEDVDEKTKKLELRAPTGFMRDWINDNYRSRILTFTESFGFELGKIRLIE